MNNSADSESGFLKRAQSVYAESLSALDPDVLDRLRNARQQAVAEAERPAPLWRVHPWAVPTGATAVILAGVISVLLVGRPADQGKVPFAAADNSDMAIVLSNDNLDMYADMEFYRWLQAQNQAQMNGESTESDDNG